MKYKSHEMYRYIMNFETFFLQLSDAYSNFDLSAYLHHNLRIYLPSIVVN